MVSMGNVCKYSLENRLLEAGDQVLYDVREGKTMIESLTQLSTFLMKADNNYALQHGTREALPFKGSNSVKNWGMMCFV